MKITGKQNHVLQNLHRIEITAGSAKRSYLLDGEDCRYQIIGLAARGMVSWTGRGRPSKIAEPDGITGTTWKRPEGTPA